MQGNMIWFSPDGDCPPLGDSLMKVHEFNDVLNPNAQDATVTFTLYFENEEPVRDIKMLEPAERGRGFQTHNPEHFGEHILSASRKYAARIQIDVPVIAPYGRLDACQENLVHHRTVREADDETFRSDRAP